ncbi:MAG: hypothetical protein ACXVCV_17435 [Polyangia bacterium]
MRWRRVVIALLVVGTLAFAGLAAFAKINEPQVVCMLPGMVPCLSDPECSAFGATCDVPAGACACPSIDAGAGDGGNRDAGGGGTADFGGGGGGGGGSTVGSGTGPRVGGGMSGPPKSVGCSFVPGSAR